MSQSQAEWWTSATPADVSTLPLQLGEHEVGRGKYRPARIPFLRTSLSSRAYTQKLSIPGGNQEKAVREIHMECERRSEEGPSVKIPEPKLGSSNA